jgi:threonine dehydratase
MIVLEDIRAAADRIAGRVRRTPVMQATQLKTPVTEAELVLKLELLQVTGSFKARGATNCLLATPAERIARGIVAASGGNHGLAVARAGALAAVPVTIFLPENVTPAKVEKLKLWGAETVITGTVWDETNRAALAFVEETGRAYFHPFADPLVVAGQGTVALEILEQDPEVDTLLVAIGGGGLISGVAVAAKALKPSVRVIGIEAEGSPTLKRSVEAGHTVGLEAVTTSVATMACGRTDDRVFEVVRRGVDEIVLVSDDEMRAAARWLWFETGLAADLSGAAAVAALQAGRIVLPPASRACAIVCGAGPDALLGG